MMRADEGRPQVPLRVKVPQSLIVGIWRPPWWQRILFPAIGLVMIGGAVWPYAGEPYEPIWIGVAVGAVLLLPALRPKLTLFEDAVYIRGYLLSRLIPIEQIALVEGGYGGLDFWWGDGHFSSANSIGEQTNIEGLPGSDGRRHTIRTLILTTRDEFLERHGLIALPDPHEEDERRRREFQERGWVEHNPRPTREAKSRDED